VLNTHRILIYALALEVYINIINSPIKPEVRGNPILAKININKNTPSIGIFDAMLLK